MPSSATRSGKVVFEQKNIEVPKSWSMLATNVVASKYFRGTPARRSARLGPQLVARVVDTITGWGGASVLRLRRGGRPSTPS